MAARRSYGAGQLYTRRDGNGRETWYGRWYVAGSRVKRKIGLKRVPGSRAGLTPTQAENELRRLMMAEVPGTPLAGDALTMEELGRRYSTHLRRQGRKKATLVAVESILRIWLVPFFAERDLRRIKAEDVLDLVSMMEAGHRPGPRTRGDRRYGRPVGVKSIRNYIGTLSAMLGYAERKGWLPNNVAHRIDLPAAPTSEDIRFLNPGEVMRLAQCVPPSIYQSLDQALYLTAAMTGLRQGELVALRWCDVDWSAARVRVRQNYVLGEFGTPKSKRSTRSVPLADIVARTLRSRYEASGSPSSNALVFADPINGGPLNKAALLRRYRRALKAARIDTKHRFHDLRHTFGTRMAAAGVPMRTLQEWMGHRDIETTQRYADYAPGTHEATLVEAAFRNLET
jgi:integrase